MKKKSEKQKAKRKSQSLAWEEFFSTNTPGQETPFSGTFENTKIAEVRAQHETELLRYPNVVGVSEGIRTKQGKPTGEPCLVILVQQKISRNKLSKKDILPDQIDGVLVDIVEVGKVEALPL